MIIRLRYDRCRLCVFVCVQDRLLISQVSSKNKYLALSTNEILISINWSFEPNGLGDASIFIKNVDVRSVYVSQDLNKYRMFVMIFQQENLCHSLNHQMSLFSKFTITSTSNSLGKMVNFSTFYPGRPAFDLDYQTSHM